MKITATQLIRNYLDKKGISQSALANMIGEKRQNLNQKLLNDDMGCAMVQKISIALEYDFFYELSNSLPKEITRKNKLLENSSELELAIVDIMKKNFPQLK